MKRSNLRRLILVRDWVTAPNTFSGYSIKLPFVPLQRPQRLYCGNWHVQEYQVPYMHNDVKLCPPSTKSSRYQYQKNPSNEHKINLQSRLTVQNNWDTKWRKSHTHKIETRQWSAKEEVLDQAGRFEAWWSISPRGFPPSKTPLTLKYLIHTISHTHI